MSEYANPSSSTSNPILDPRVYWRVSGFALAVAAVAGFVVNIVAGNHAGIEGFLVFDWLHNTLHGVLALAALVFAYAPLRTQLVKAFAVTFGFVYGGLGVVGLILGQWSLVPGLHVELAENLIHLALGGWALAAGFMARP